MKKYPISFLFTTVHEMITDMGLDIEVKDVVNFGYDVTEGTSGALFIEALVKDENGILGRERHVRWIERDISYEDWGKPPVIS